MKKFLLSALFLLGVLPSLLATTYYTVDVGNGGEWSLDAVTPCNCQPLGNAEDDNLLVGHDINFQLTQFNGRMEIDSGTVTINGSYNFSNAGLVILSSGELNITGAITFDNSQILVIGSIVANGSVVLTNTSIYGQGVLDFTNASVFSNLSSINGTTIDVTTSSSTVDLSTRNLNVWDGSNWSKGRPPRSCNEYASISGDYSTNNGNINAGLLIIGDYEVNVEADDYVDVCNLLVNGGNFIIKNKGSLVQRLNCALINSGNFKVEREGQHKDFKYNIWSSPVQSGKHLENIFQQTNPCDMFVFDSENQVWKYDYSVGHQTTCLGNPVTFGVNDVIPGGNGNMDIGRGYFVPGPNSSASFTREFEGVVNNGDITVQVSTTAEGDTEYWYGDDWNMIGNPYPSSLDCFEFWEENAGKHGILTDGIYLWVEDTESPYDQFANYLVWNPMGATYIKKKPDQGGGEDLTNSQPFDGVIPSCSGFWVTTSGNDGGGQGQGNATAVRDLHFNNNMRLRQGEDLVPKSQSYDLHSEALERAWFTLTTDSFNYDQILVGHHQKATDSVDLLYDARFNPAGNGVLFASVIDSVPYTIQGLAPRLNGETYYIELLVATTDTSQHYITLDSVLNYLGNKEVFLVDSVLSTREKLYKDVPQAIQLDSTGVFAERFYLEVITHPVYVEDAPELSFDGRVWVNDKTLFFDDFEVQVSQMEVFSVSGQQLLSKQVNSRNSSISIHNLEAGIYFVKCVSVNGELLTKRVFVQ